MSTQEQKKYLIENYKKTLNLKSKWYTQDIEDFKTSLSNSSDKKIELMYNNAIAFNSTHFSKQIEKEENKMLKAGLYEIGNMKPQNALN